VKGPLSSEQISSIFGFHPSVHFVTLVSEDGTLLDSVKRAGLNPLEPPEETRKSLERWAAARDSLAGSDKFLGRMKTIIVRRDKLIELLFPLAGFMIIISVHPAFPLDKTANLKVFWISCMLAGTNGVRHEKRDYVVSSASEQVRKYPGRDWGIGDHAQV
jgi:hypothetical protein